MSLDAPSLSAHELRDRLESRPVSDREVLLKGMVWDVVRDTVDLGEAGTVRREYVLHPGAVGTVAMDDKGRILLVQQYRHPVGHYDWELPAGLLDVEGEPPWEAAARELHEEAGLEAAQIGGPVGEPHFFDISLGRVCQFNFVVQGKLDAAEVKLDPKEHQNFVWATEAEVKADKAGNVDLVFTRDEVKRTVLSAFDHHREQK